MELGNMVLIYVGAAITLLAAIIPALLIEEPRVLNNVSEETKKKMSEAQKGRIVSQETKDKLRLAWEIRKQSKKIKENNDKVSF